MLVAPTVLSDGMPNFVRSVFRTKLGTSEWTALMVVVVVVVVVVAGGGCCCWWWLLLLVVVVVDDDLAA